jgi:hypothetical protein
MAHGSHAVALSATMNRPTSSRISVPCKGPARVPPAFRPNAAAAHTYGWRTPLMQQLLSYPTGTVCFSQQIGWGTVVLFLTKVNAKHPAAARQRASHSSTFASAGSTSRRRSLPDRSRLGSRVNCGFGRAGCGCGACPIKPNAPRATASLKPRCTGRSLIDKPRATSQQSHIPKPTQSVRDKTSTTTWTIQSVRDSVP